MEQTAPPPLPTQTTCQWCQKPMNSDAIRCSSCGKLRKDIYTDKVRCYSFCFVGGLLIGLSIILWGGNKQNGYYYNNQGSSGNTTGYVLLVAGIIAAIAGIYYYIKASQKLKTYWWI